MDKNLLLQDVLSHLQTDLEQASLAALSAHEAATHEENVAENKYDTLGLEAAYLASGQARRVEELRQTLITWRQLRPRPFDIEQGIELGALVQLASGECAIVVRRGATATTPLVGCITDRNGAPIVDTPTRDTAEAAFAIVGAGADKSLARRVLPERFYGLPAA